jgi:hypothetical protein
MKKIYFIILGLMLVSLLSSGCMYMTRGDDTIFKAVDIQSGSNAGITFIHIYGDDGRFYHDNKHSNIIYKINSTYKCYNAWLMTSYSQVYECIDGITEVNN